MKQITFESKRILDDKIDTLKNDEQQLNRIFKKELKKIYNDKEGLKRSKNNLKISEINYKKIKEIKSITKQPIWRIVETVLERAEVVNKNKNYHIEPDLCPECGSSDLLIQSGDHYWYCYNCEADGHY